MARSERESGTRMKVVGRRVDAMYLAYRVELASDVVHYLKQRQIEATKHGQASVRWRSIVGTMNFSRTSNTWHVETTTYQLQVFLKGPGGDTTPEGEELTGWTVELVWAAQELANMRRDMRPAIEEGKRIAAELGTVLESRLRRFDLCADVAGWKVAAGDSERLVRRSRAKLHVHNVDTEAATAKLATDLVRRVNKAITKHMTSSLVRVYENSRGVTGMTVCPGGHMMLRAYDKREHLAVTNDPEKTEAEETRWKDGGWDGEEPVTRVEYQLRGDAIKELGLRDPDRPLILWRDKNKKVCSTPFKGTFGDRIDAVWQRCLRWARLVTLTKERRSECPNDPVWNALEAVRFVCAALSPARRFRIRRHASVEQTFGCVLSVVGAKVGLPAVRPWAALTNREPNVALAKYLSGVFESAAAVVGEDLTKKWDGAAKALEHVLTVHDAVRARFGDVEVTPSVHSVRCGLSPPIASSA